MGNGLNYIKLIILARLLNKESIMESRSMIRNIIISELDINKSKILDNKKLKQTESQ